MTWLNFSPERGHPVPGSTLVTKNQLNLPIEDPGRAAFTLWYVLSEAAKDAVGNAMTLNTVWDGSTNPKDIYQTDINNIFLGFSTLSMTDGSLPITDVNVEIACNIINGNDPSQQAKSAVLKLAVLFRAILSTKNIAFSRTDNRTGETQNYGLAGVELLSPSIIPVKDPELPAFWKVNLLVRTYGFESDTVVVTNNINHRIGV